MMRKLFVCTLIILSLALILPGCGTEPAPQTTTPEETTIPAETAIPAATDSPVPTTTPTQTAHPTETTVPATEVPTVPTAMAAPTLPYLQHIDRADQSIYEGPGYDYVFVGTVRERGTYTIVEEAWDYEGNLWGKLKSGIGWVDLTQIRSEAYTASLISANYADEYLLTHGAYHYYAGEKTDYTVTVAFRAYGFLRDVELFAYDFSDNGLVPGDAFFTLPEWMPDMPLVAELSFPGDLSTCGIRFVDESGVTHTFSIYISGRNGALMLSAE